MSAMKTEQRDELGAEEFAVPGKRKLPINDEKHIRMAWDMVDRTQGLSDAERSEARKHILAAAKRHDIDTSDWGAQHAEEYVSFADVPELVACFTDDAPTYGHYTGPDGVQIPYVDKPALLFYAGTHKGRTYSEGDIDQMARSFVRPRNDLDCTVPLKLGHPKEDDPTKLTGSLRATWAKAGKLYGIVRSVGKEAVEKVASGLWRRLSIEHYPELRLRAVSIVSHPHLAGASMFAEGGPEMSKTKETPKEKEEPKEPEAEGGEGEPEEEDEPKPKGKKKPAKAASYAEDPELSAQFADFQQRISSLEETNSALVKKQRFAEHSALVTKFAEEGRTLPVFAEQELAFVQSLSDEQIAAYSELKGKQPPYVEFSRLSSPHIQPAGGDSAANQAAVTSRADRMLSHLGMDPATIK